MGRMLAERHSLGEHWVTVMVYYAAGQLVRACGDLQLARAEIEHGPHDDLLRRFVADLKRRGLPDSRVPDLWQLGPPSGPACSAVMPGDAYPVAANCGRAP